ncbi:MAG: hypothetical protein WAO35_22975 [Terriglobia bacterium]
MFAIPPDAFVCEALDKILAEAAAPPAKPKKSAYGLLAKYGPGPTEEEIDANRREMFRSFGEDLP